MAIKITAFSTYNDASQGFAGRINSATTHFIGRHAPSSTQYLDANLSQVYLIDGQSLGPQIILDLMIHSQILGVQRKFKEDPYTVNDGSIGVLDLTNWTDPARF